MKIIIPLMTIFLSAAQAFGAAPATIGMPCADSNTQSRRSAELKKLREADQADRAWQINSQNGAPQPTQDILEKMARNDLKRRKRVGQIFGEGCFKTADDYEAAFIVYQHGNTSDQYFQAYLWSKQSLTLGNGKVKGEVAMAIDRYLVSIGHRQLFGTQASQAEIGGCWCIQPIEDTFPESLRSEYRGGPNAAYTGLSYLKILNKGTNCPASYCDKSFLASPAGTVPGFW